MADSSQRSPSLGRPPLDFGSLQPPTANSLTRAVRDRPSCRGAGQPRGATGCRARCGAAPQLRFLRCPQQTCCPQTSVSDLCPRSLGGNSRSSNKTATPQTRISPERARGGHLLTSVTQPRGQTAGSALCASLCGVPLEEKEQDLSSQLSLSPGSELPSPENHRFCWASPRPEADARSPKSSHTPSTPGGGGHAGQQTSHWAEATWLSFPVPATKNPNTGPGLTRQFSTTVISQRTQTMC